MQTSIHDTISFSDTLELWVYTIKNGEAIIVGFGNEGYLLLIWFSWKRKNCKKSFSKLYFFMS